MAFAATLASFAQNAAEVLDKAVANITKASSVNCSFKIESADGKLNGTFKSSGKKFKLETPVSTTWYDGKDMWTSNPRSKQITLVKPDSQEINEVNPFAYLNSYKGKYKVFFSKHKDNNRYLVLLNPKNTKDEIKAVEIAINKKTYLPERFIIRDRYDKVTTLYVNSLTLTSANPPATFVCPVESMKDYEVVDLR